MIFLCILWHVPSFIIKTHILLIAPCLFPSFPKNAIFPLTFYFVLKHFNDSFVSTNFSIFLSIFCVVNRNSNQAKHAVFLSLLCRFLTKQIDYDARWRGGINRIAQEKVDKSLRLSHWQTHMFTHSIDWLRLICVMESILTPSEG